MSHVLLGGAPTPPPPFAVLPLRGVTLFPGTVLSIRVGRSRSMALLSEQHEGDIIAVATQKDGRAEDPKRDGLYDLGGFARIVKLVRTGSEGYAVTLEGLGRLRLGDLWRTDPYWKADGVVLVEPEPDGESHVLGDALRAQVKQLASGSGGGLDAAVREASPGLLAYYVAFGLGLTEASAQQVLAAESVTERLRTVLDLLGKAAAEVEVRGKVEEQVRKSFGDKQREAVLREQLRAIRRELGETDGDDQDELTRLRQRLELAALPEEARQVAERELKRLESSGGQGPEANVIRNYLELMADLPWNRQAPTDLDLDRIARQLDADHTGLDDVKQRVLEHMAVLGLSGNPRGTILCLVGPPGVGKTSLGASIAAATGRPLARVALGGVRDEAEIRGHRRTYVGALPGRIIHALRKVGVKNPVLLLDEVDKLGSGWAGWPEAALLEVLDPEQNVSFVDHYLETPFDLSQVMFICTANTLDTISAPLRDRLEIIELNGYTLQEKSGIARRHLIPKRVREHGIPEGALELTEAGLERIIADYTKEAGVRQLDREIRRLCRGAALEVARGQKRDEPVKLVIGEDDLRVRLGKPRFHTELAERTSYAGVATGLAWTPFGGDILFIETSLMPGKGRIEITGQLGDVMKESARAALSYVRSHADQLELRARGLDEHDLHIHVPAGAVPKDGPSAGVAIFTALASLLSDRRVRSDTAMTGECTLRGKVLPVGGIKAKLLAAHRAGIRRVILPAKNQPDLDEVPQSTRDELEIILADDMAEVLAAALESERLPTGIGTPPMIPAPPRTDAHATGLGAA